MKKRKGTFLRSIICILLLSFFIVFSLVSCSDGEPGFITGLLEELGILGRAGSIINPGSEIRGVWISSVFNINYPSSPDKTEQELKSEIDSIIGKCLECGLNTVFFQVRPSCDALYDSGIFPVSSFLYSDRVLYFDPLEYFVREAHLHNIFLYAWINPLRVTVTADSEKSLPTDSPAVVHSDMTFKYTDGRVYLDPGFPEVRKLVSDGVAEVVRKYDVDGVVFDDYFYPYPVENGVLDDSSSYSLYGEGRDRGDYRRENVNALVKESFEAVKSIRDDCLFGVAPFGVWQNDNGSNGGSATNNFEAYNSLYCDALAFADGGYVDFISPQLYWRDTDSYREFSVTADWWNRKLDGTGVNLIISLGAYKYADGWDSPEGTVESQIAIGREKLTYKGCVLYGYEQLRDNVSDIDSELKRAYQDEIIYYDISSDGTGVSLSPGESGEYEAGSHAVKFVSDPGLPLLYGDEKVSRNKDGSFEIVLDIASGENEILFNSGDRICTVKIRGY